MTKVDRIYINNYYEMWAEDIQFDDEYEVPEELNKIQYSLLNQYIQKHPLYNQICIDIKKWESDPLMNYVMSEDLEDICLEWFDNNIVKKSVV